VSQKRAPAPGRPVLRPRAPVAVACTVAALVVSAQAFAGFRCPSTDTLTVSTAVLASPTGPSAGIDTCMPATSVSVQVTWTPSAAADGYAIFRADGGGAASQVGTVSGNATADFVDAGVAFSSDYAYSVVALRGQWTSAATGDATVTTPGPTCT
jgi:hypothetical protein